LKPKKLTGFTTEILAEFVSDLSPDQIPASTFEAAKKCVIDITAASLAGFKASNPAKSMAEELFAPGDIAVWFSGESLSATGAAYVNSSSSSALDLDDGHRQAMGHPGASIIPAVLAVAQEIDASGVDFLTAVIIGYEVAVRVAAARDHEKLTTLSSGRWCPYGVAAAAGWLYKLAPDKLAQAISIAGVQAPELSASGYSKLMGNNVKEGIPWSTVTGLSALMLAKNNYTGPLDILDHPNFFDSKKIIDGLGESFAIENVYFKPYACCRWIHSAIDALLMVMEKQCLTVNQIASIDVHLFKRATMLTNQTDPDTIEGAQYSVQYSMAIAAILGKEALCPMGTDLIGRRELNLFAEKISLFEDKELTKLFPDTASARIVVHSTKGVFEKFVQYPLGDPANPMSIEMIVNKLNGIAAKSSCLDNASKMVDVVHKIENCKVSSLTNILGAKML